MDFRIILGMKGGDETGIGEEDKECQGESDRTVVWYLVRCFTVRGEWHIINRIYLACMILYTKLTFFLSIDQPGSAGL